MNKQELMAAVKNDTLYDFAANNYYNMSKEELKDLILELVYTAHCVFSKSYNVTERQQYAKMLFENLNERFAHDES